MLNFVDKLQQFIKNSDNWHLAFSNHFTHKYKTLPRLYCIFWPMLIHLFFSSSFLSLSFSLFFSYISFFSSFFLHFQKGGGCNPLTLLLWSTTVFSLGYYISNHMCARINPRLPHTCIEYFSFNLFLCKAMIVQCYGNLRKLYGDEFIPVSWSKCFYR